VIFSRRFINTCFAISEDMALTEELGMRLREARTSRHIGSIFDSANIADIMERAGCLYQVMDTMLRQESSHCTAEKPELRDYFSRKETPAELYDRYCLSFLRNLALIRHDPRVAGRVFAQTEEEEARLYPIRSESP